MRTGFSVFAVSLLAAFALAGCGGGSGDDSSSGTTSTSEWADDLCSAIVDWTDSVSSATTSLKDDGLSKEGVQSAADDVGTATETFVDNVAGSAQRRIVFITSRMGSIACNLSGGHYGYRASKAALNAIGRSLAIDLFRRGITMALLHPGWVDTAGGGGGAPVSVQESVAAMRHIVARLGNHETGQFCAYTGQPLPW